MTVAEEKKLVSDLIMIGLVSTAISIPIGLWAIPKFRDKVWISAALLTAAGYVVKSKMLAH